MSEKFGIFFVASTVVESISPAMVFDVVDWYSKYPEVA
jgi:hypothetical protein